MPFARLSSAWFTLAWTVLLLGCLLFLGRRRVLVALALIAFLPVAVEFWFRNIHLVLAVLVVLSVERGWLVERRRLDQAVARPGDPVARRTRPLA